MINQKERQKVEMKEIVCVTGAGGFLASWVVKYLLAEGFIVRATVRNPSDEKYDLLDYHSLFAAVAGCRGVFHVASPELIEPALIGTHNVLKACTEPKVKRVVVVSSIAAVMLNPNWPKGNPMNELCWSENEYCKASENWCFLSKTEAESEAWEYAKKKGLHLVTVCPALIIGPMLQSTVNASSSILLKILKDGAETMVNKDQRIVDVRDVTRAVLLAYEKCEAEGRYICSAYMVKTQDLIEKLKTMYPKYNYPQKITEADDQPKLNCEKMQKLGWTHRTLEECLTDSVICYQEKGILD